MPVMAKALTRDTVLLVINEVLSVTLVRPSAVTKDQPLKQPVVALAGAVLIVAALAGCSSLFHHAPKAAATPKATAAAQDQLRLTCSQQASWALRGEPAVKALYADTGALAADARANNAPGIVKAGRKLASDALAAASLPLPPVDPASWKALTVDYAAAGTAIAGGDSVGGVPQLEAGNSAISAFSAATGKCAGLS
jgi:hypothetical protein